MTVTHWASKPHPGRRLRDRARADSGLVEVEFALGTVVLLAFLMLVVGVFRVVDAEADVQTAASAAARAASRRGSPAAATSAARETAVANLATGTTTCGSIEVETEAGGLEPGGSVTVTVRCTIDNADLVLLAAPGHRSFASTATAVVDRFRGGGS